MKQRVSPLDYSIYIKITFKLFVSLILFSLCLNLSGCASDSYASKGAASGATQGAAAGAVGGLVSALVFGGDPLDRAARGAVYGGATGAVAGGIAGSNKDKQIRAQQQAQEQARAQTQTQAVQEADLKALKKEIGKPAYHSLAALAECQHTSSLEKAKKSQKSNNSNYRLAGLWLEVLNYADLQQQEQVNKLLPLLVAEDPDINSEAEAKKVTREAAAELITIRREFDLPLVCNT
jgi:hypothetical protein